MGALAVPEAPVAEVVHTYTTDTAAAVVLLSAAFVLAVVLLDVAFVLAAVLLGVVLVLAVVLLGVASVAADDVAANDVAANASCSTVITLNRGCQGGIPHALPELLVGWARICC